MARVDRIFLKRTEIIIDGLKGTAQVIKLPPFDKLNYLYQVSFQIKNSKENKCDVYTNKLSKVYGKPNKTRDLSYSHEPKITEDSGLTIKFSYFDKLSDWKVGNSRLLLRCDGIQVGDQPASQWFTILFKKSEYAHEIKDVIWISCDLLYEYHTPDGTENRGSKIVIVGLDDFDRKLLKPDKSIIRDRVRYNADFVEVRSEGNNNIVTTTLINRLTGEMNMKFMSTKDNRYYQTGIGSCEITDINKKKF